MMDISKSAEYKERSEGHRDLWSGTLMSVIQLLTPEIQRQQTKHKVPNKVITTAIGFLRLKYDEQKLAGTVQHEVALAIDEALVYHVNVLGEDV